MRREELDRVCPDKELMVVKYDGHACVTNSKLLAKLRAKAENLRGYHPDTGEMNQEAFFRFSDYITGSLSIPELYRNMQIAVDFLASRGIGCVHTVSGVGFVGNLDISLEKNFARSLKNGFQLRVLPQPMNVKVATSRKLPRIGGCFACALDGCFGSHDAALKEPYVDGGAGVLYYEDEKVADFCKQANRAGLQIELHAMKLPEAAKKAADGIEETLTYCDFPSEHWTKIRTNNVIERMNREIRRRTRVVGAFPDGNSALMLVCARLRHVAGTQWGSKKYMNMKHLEAMEQESLVG